MSYFDNRISRNEFITTRVLIGRLSSMSVWVIPTVASIAGAGIYLVKYRD